MLANRGRALLIGGLVAALAGTEVIARIVRTGSSGRAAQAALLAVEKRRVETSVARHDRLAFVAPGAVTWPFPETLLPELRPLIEPETSGGDPWEIAVHRETLRIRPSLAPDAAAPAERRKKPLHKKSYSLKERLAEISPGATARLAKKFLAASALWPPAEATLIAIKDEKVLELHAREKGADWKLIHRYKILAASGGLGPKLLRGDRRVPEGIYSISYLNPNSAYHVSLRVNYPNSFDRQMAAKDGRKDLGGDIMIHGKNLSAGCLAMGDEVAEELFVLVAQVGKPNVKLIIAPTDLRHKSAPASTADAPAWQPQLYAEVAAEMSGYKRPPSTGLLSFFTR
jgi:hypothetical protein